MMEKKCFKFSTFTIFPENQVIKIEVGETSPNSFTATRFLSVVDEQKTNLLKEEAVNNVPPVYSIDSTVSSDVIDGITEMFLTVIKSRTDEILEQSNDAELEESNANLIIIQLTKSEQIQKANTRNASRSKTMVRKAKQRKAEQNKATQRTVTQNKV